MPRSGVLAELARLAGTSRYRHLLGVRLAGQSADGAFQAGLASLFFFSPERQASPEQVAFASAVLLLPFTVVGPWAGVLLDRRPRRSVLGLGNLLRAALAVGAAAALAAGAGDVLVGALALAVLSVNRALLAGLSAALPRVVVPEQLVIANSVTPSAGTVAAGTGAAVTVALTAAAGTGGSADVVALLVAAGGYLLAGALALRFPRGLLGPDPAARPAAARGAAAVVRDSVRDVVAGVAHLRERRAAAAALSLVAWHRWSFGLTTVAVVVLCRRVLGEGDPAAGLAALGVLLSAVAAGSGAAAVLAPWGARRGRLRGWISGCLLVAGAGQLVVGLSTSLAVLAVAAAALGLGGQGSKIGVDTVVQRSVDDAYRGRVFTAYDLVFNVSYCLACGAAVLVVPADGRLGAVAVLLAAGYAALAFALARRRVGVRTTAAP
ncbi:MFS transporter [Paenibacillus sp. TRM 82003]|uniref:MFS transporter n=1 Tax=Kineococcus sp. TRM81007 TaxID=2925831 RepID=UPI001F5926C8|nr:MFS transporter [Kineococcus sp. TRM81007]MCI2236948.1 MFS transporter [Kineococcus sp. TRM81007]MCI3926395.1 MFS transporter [Paenibacillus sp. TRM 82003]